MPIAISEQIIDRMLDETARDRADLRVNLKHQRILIPRHGLPAKKGELKMIKSIVQNVHENPVTVKWQGYVYRRRMRIHVEYIPMSPQGYWQPCHFAD